MNLRKGQIVNVKWKESGWGEVILWGDFFGARVLSPGLSARMDGDSRAIKFISVVRGLTWLAPLFLYK